MQVKILAIGDIVGKPGRALIRERLPSYRREAGVHFVVANAENIAGGSGITRNLFDKIRSYGIDVVTLGDHIYKKSDIVPTLQTSERVVRPANLAAGAAGRPFTVVQSNKGLSVGVFSVLGRIFMNMPSNDPFAAADWVLDALPGNV